MNALDSQTLSGYFHVADIGGGGLRMYSQNPMDTGEQIDLEVDLNNGHTLNCKGEVIWQKELDDQAPAHYDVGVQFVGLTRADEQALDAFLNAH